MSVSETCDICAAGIPAHEHFIVRIDVFADPTLPDFDASALADANIMQTIDELMKQMQSMTTDELQDGVHRRFAYRLCAACHKRFLANPLGLPRTQSVGQN